MTVDSGSYLTPSYDSAFDEDTSYLSSSFTQAFGAAPELANTPSLLVAAAQSQDPAQSAVGLAHLTAQTQVQETAKEEHHWWSSALHSVTHTAAEGIGAVLSNPVVHTTLEWAAKPLGAVQHEYRYLKEMSHQHGFLAAFGEGLVMAGVGVVVGAATLNPLAGIAAAELVGYGLGQVVDHEAWEKTEHSGGSFGRDVAHLVGLEDTDSGFGQVLSGTLDATFDIAADPLIVAGKLHGAAKGAEGIGAARTVRRYSVADRKMVEVERSARAINSIFPGLGIRSPELVDAARDRYGSYKRVLKDLSRENADEGYVLTHYGSEMAPVAKELAEANTEDAVHQVFREQASFVEEKDRILLNTLPSRSVLRVKTQHMADRLIGGVDRKNELPLLFGARRPVGNAYTSRAGLAFQPQLWIKSDAWKGVAAKKMRTFSGYVPFAINDVTGEISSTHLDLSNNNNLQALLRIARFSMGESSARKWLKDFTSYEKHDLTNRKAKYGELLIEVLKAAGLPDDPQMVARITSWSRHLARGAEHSTSYGSGSKLGDAVSVAMTGDGPQRLALHSFQAESVVTMPNFRALRREMHDAGMYQRWYGKLDDFAADHYTNSFFKPLALITAGFGMRVAASEAIPGMFRNGAWNFAKARVVASAAKSKYKLEGDEAEQQISIASRMLGGFDNFLNNAEDRELSLGLIRENGVYAHGVSGSGHSSHTRPDDPKFDAEYGIDQVMKRQVRMAGRPTGDFEQILPGNPHYVDEWQYGLVRRAREKNVQLTAADFKAGLSRGMSADDAAVFAAKRESQRIQGIDPTTGKTFAEGADPYFKERGQLSRYEHQDSQVFAMHRVDDMRNHITGADGTVHDDLLQKFIDGDNAIHADDLRNIDPELRPATLSGHIYEPFMPSDVFHAVITSGFKKIVNPVIDWVSREPLFFLEYKKQYKTLQHAVRRGELTEESARRYAQVRAMRGIIPQIHNTALRSQFAVMASNFMPFYFAQEQALKRAGHLIRRHPEAFRKYQLMVHGLSDPAFIHEDDQGNRYLVMPMVGEFGAMAINAFTQIPALGGSLQGGLPMTVSGDMESLKTVLPELQTPGMSPFAAIGIKKLVDIDPMFGELAKAVLGERGYNPDKFSVLIPNTALRSAVHGIMADEGDRVFANAMLTALQSAAYHGQLPGPEDGPREWAAFMDRIKNNARTVLMIKAVAAEVSPLSPRVEQSDYGLRDEWYETLRNSKDGYEGAVQDFLAKHGDAAVSYTVAKSESKTGGYAPITKASEEFVLKYRDLLENHQWGASFTIPQETDGEGDAQVIYDELLRSKLRERRTPEEFRDSLYIGQGMRTYDTARTDYEAQLAQVAGTADEAILRSAWNTWLTQDFALNQPLAYNYLTSQERHTNAKLAYQDIVTMFADGSAPENEQAQLLYQLSSEYEDYRATLVSLGEGTGDRTMSEQRSAIKDAWSAYLAQKTLDEPRLANVISAVFKRLTEDV